jgi:hypothetical protein
MHLTLTDSVRCYIHVAICARLMRSFVRIERRRHWRRRPSTHALSQEPVPTPPDTAIVGRSPKYVVNVLAKHLSLTEEQKSKILPIIIERQRQIQDVRASSTLFVRQKQGQMRGINETAIGESTHSSPGTNRKLTPHCSRKGKFSDECDKLRASRPQTRRASSSARSHRNALPSCNARLLHLQTNQSKRYFGRADVSKPPLLIPQPRPEKR